MRNFGLIGYPLTHSFSAAFFKHKFLSESINAQYTNFEIPNLDQLRALIEKENLSGFNVTIPYKIAVSNLCEHLSREAIAIGAVNCVSVIENSILKGHNTDATGFHAMLMPHLPYIENKKALILGTGGSSKAVSYVLKSLNFETLTVSRTPKAVDHIDYNSINKINLSSYDLIVNTTPVGMFPKVQNMPLVPIEKLTAKHIILDLIYNPAQTMLLQEASKKLCRIQNGLPMLFAQAEASWQFWNQ